MTKQTAKKNVANTQAKTQTKAQSKTSRLISLEIFVKVRVNSETGEKFNAYCTKLKDGSFAKVVFARGWAKPSWGGTIKAYENDLKVIKDNYGKVITINRYKAFEPYEPSDEGEQEEQDEMPF